jgi:peptide/nickel transport system substrate-binding protein
MVFRSRLGSGALAALACVTFVACGDDGDGDSGTGATDGGDTTTTVATGGECTEERIGGEVTMGVLSEARGLDPTVTGGTGRTGDTELAAIYDTLMRYDADEGVYVPHLAESLESDDDQTWTLTLRSGVTFGNGDPLTAADVRDHIERVKTGQNATPRSLAAQVASMEVVDDLTLELSLESPFAGFPGVLASGTGMVVNPRVVASMSPEEFNLMPTGAGVGPYEPVRYAPGEEIVLEAKDDYWGGPVCIQTLRFVFIAGAQATYDALSNDEIGVAYLREPIVIAQAKDDGFDGFSQIQNAGEALALNSGVGDTEPRTADPRVRRAIQLALDPELVDDRANEGQGLPTSTLMWSESRLDPGVEGLTQDQDAARELVEEVKADTGWDGGVDLLCDVAPYRQETAIVVEALLEEVGFEVEVESNVPISDLVARVFEGNFEIACWGLNVNDENPWIGLDQFRSDSPSNYAGYANDDVDAAIADLRVAGSDDDAVAALGSIQEAWNEDPAVAVLAAFENYVTWSSSVQGIIPSANASILFHDAFIE